MQTGARDCRALGPRRDGFPLAAGDEQTKWSRFNGTVHRGGVAWSEADSIPNLGTTAETQLIVSAAKEALALFEGEPVLGAYPQPKRVIA